MSSTSADLLEVDPAPLVGPPAGSSASAPVVPHAPKTRTFSRRRLLRNLLGFGVVGASGAYGRDVEPFWVEWHDVPMPLRNLPKSFDGFRIAQLTDLHSSHIVPLSYLREVVEQVKRSKPNLVVVTGDLVTHTLEFVAGVCDLLGELPAAGIPTVATFGNHDYDIGSSSRGGLDGQMTAVADALEARLTDNKVSVLRNRAMPLRHDDGRVWIVGLEDLWSGRFSPQIAFAGVRADEPIIALSHNPDTAEELDAYGAQWTLAGHTHGGQVRVPGVGALILNVQNKTYDQGQFALPRSTLYVSRGVGYLMKARLFCRPEVPTFVLRRA